MLVTARLPDIDEPKESGELSCQRLKAGGLRAPIYTRREPEHEQRQRI